MSFSNSMNHDFGKKPFVRNSMFLIKNHMMNGISSVKMSFDESNFWWKVNSVNLNNIENTSQCYLIEPGEEPTPKPKPVEKPAEKVKKAEPAPAQPK